jgi:hypothetical protein
VEYFDKRKLRTRNKVHYRLAHWPIWIWVFFLSPGPMVFDLFAYGPSRRTLIWLAVVIMGTGIAGLFGELPGVEPAPYILRFTEDKPNPLYRRICYTFAWNVVLNFALLNLAGLVVAVATGHWYLKQIYATAYFPLAIVIWGLGALGRLPRVMKSTAGEGYERRYFYGAVWAVCVAQPVLGVLWHVIPRSRLGDVVKLIVFVGVLAGMAMLAVGGHLPRTRRILPGEEMVAD